MYFSLCMFPSTYVPCFQILSTPRRIGQARVEVLLRQQAFKPKVSSSGQKLSGESGKSNLGSKYLFHSGGLE